MANVLSVDQVKRPFVVGQYIHIGQSKALWEVVSADPVYGATQVISIMRARLRTTLPWRRVRAT